MEILLSHLKMKPQGRQELYSTIHLSKPTVSQLLAHALPFSLAFESRFGTAICGAAVKNS